MLATKSTSPNATSLRKRDRLKATSIKSTRWAAYAAAGAAAAAAASSADADIFYSGTINQAFDAAPGNSVVQMFQLGAAGNFFTLQQRRGTSSGSAFFRIQGAASARFAGFNASTGSSSSHPYVSKLAFGDNIAGAQFINQFPGQMALNTGYDNSQWLSAGTGYVGFKFDTGAGTEYGWVRITMDSGSPVNSFTVVDYAYGSPGENLSIGQVPEPGSLGLLALGGVGLIAWRKRTASKRKPAAGAV